jgi:hypothetical protein
MSWDNHPVATRQNHMWTRIKIAINLTLIGVTCGRMLAAWIRKRPVQTFPPPATAPDIEIRNFAD